MNILQGISASVIFCIKCGSALVDVWGWEGPTRADIVCANCGARTTLDGFTLGRTRIGPEPFASAARDVAVYRKDPEVINRIRTSARAELECNDRQRKESGCCN